MAKLFKEQHPKDLLTKMFMLEYFREIGVGRIYTSLDRHFRDLYFYEFTGDNDKKSYDFKWEYLLFEATLHQLEKVLEPFFDEIVEIEEKRTKELYKKLPPQAKKAINDLKANLEESRKENNIIRINND